MAKDKAAKELPSVVPANAPTEPTAAPRKRKVVRQPNTVLTDPKSIAEGIQSEYGWDDPDVAEPTPLDTEPTTPEPKPVAEPPKPSHSAVTLHLAKQLGITDAEVADSSPKELDRLVQRLYDQREDMRRESVIQQAKRNPSPGAAPATPEPSNPPAEPELSWGVDEDGKPIAEADIHPGIVGVIKAQAKELRELRDTVKQLIDREVGREQQTQAQQLDSLFAKNAEMFGTESGAAIKKSDPARFQRRLAMLQVMKALQSGDMTERFHEAHEILYGKLPSATPTPTVETPKPEPIVPPRDESGRFTKGERIHTQEEWEEAGSAVPTQRKEPAVKGRNAAIENVRRTLRDNPELLPEEDYSGEFLSANGQV